MATSGRPWPGGPTCPMVPARPGDLGLWVPSSLQAEPCNGLLLLLGFFFVCLSFVFLFSGKWLMQLKDLGFIGGIWMNQVKPVIAFRDPNISHILGCPKDGKEKSTQSHKPSHPKSDIRSHYTALVTKRERLLSPICDCYCNCCYISSDI